MPLLSRVQRIVSDVLQIALEKVTPETSPDNVETWDSIQHLNLVLAVEEKFSVQLSPEEIEEMKSVGETAKLVESKLQSTPR